MRTLTRVSTRTSTLGRLGLLLRPVDVDDDRQHHDQDDRPEDDSCRVEASSTVDVDEVNVD